MLKAILVVAALPISAAAADVRAPTPLSDGTDSNYCRHQSDGPRLYRIDGKYYCMVKATFPSSFRFAIVGADAGRQQPALEALEQKMAS